MKLRNLYRIKYSDITNPEGGYVYSGMIFTDKALAEDYARSLNEKDFKIETIPPEVCGGYWVPTIWYYRQTSAEKQSYPTKSKERVR